MEGGIRGRQSGFEKKAEAEAFITEKRKALLDGTSRAVAHRMTVAQLAAEFLRHTEARRDRNFISRRYVLNVTGHFRNYIVRGHMEKDRPAFSMVDDFRGGIGHLTLSKVRSSTADNFKDALLSTAIEHQTAKSVIISAHSMFEYAKRKEYVAINPFDGLKIETPRDARGRKVRPPLADTLSHVVQASDGILKIALIIAASTGLRLGELRALRWSKVNLAARTVSVDAAVDDKGEVGPPKSEAGYRTIPISSELVSRLKLIRPADPPEEALVFGHTDGGFLPDSFLRDRLNQTFNALGWPREKMTLDQAGKKRFHWHTLRHFAISTWISANLNPKAIQTFAGHADIGTTMNRYGHLFPDADHWSAMDAAAATWTAAA